MRQLTISTSDSWPPKRNVNELRNGFSCGAPKYTIDWLHERQTNYTHSLTGWLAGQEPMGWEFRAMRNPYSVDTATRFTTESPFQWTHDDWLVWLWRGWRHTDDGCWPSTESESPPAEKADDDVSRRYNLVEAVNVMRPRTHTLGINCTAIEASNWRATICHCHDLWPLGSTTGSTLLWAPPLVSLRATVLVSIADKPITIESIGRFVS